ncbi:protein ATP6V1FNB [Chanos chanos]|uniref:Protein ATP6V1FNB n=1 Tax=Chanos chanos TaxID=29144 RepID=A0A6J2VQW6_CHACN|nr:protein ATP6V1FNB-like [Chanos chanos]
MRSLLTTQNQNCYKELIMKEAYTRLAWKMKYSQDYPSTFVIRRSKTLGPPKLSTCTKTILPPVVNNQEKKKAATVVIERSLSDAPLMRPVSPETKQALYQGFSKEGKGRRLYLHKRDQKGPEEKYDYPLLSSWEYGWRLGDYEHDYKSPSNGRSQIVKSTFYARNGIFNIPSATDQLG